MYDGDEAAVKHLIAQFKSGDRGAFSDIVRSYQNQVRALAFKIVNDLDEAADIAQTVFLKLADNIWRYDADRKFYTWLYRITANAAIDHLRKRRCHQHELLDDYHDSLESSHVSPEHSYRRRQLRDHIADAANTLSDKQRSAFLLRDVEGCRMDHVASVMNMPEATIRWYLHRARLKVRRELLRRCPQLLILLGVR